MIALEKMGALGSLSRVGAQAYSEHTALVYEGRSTSYGALDRHVNRVAHTLLEKGHKPDTRVAILSKNSDLYMHVLLGAAKARLVTTCVNWRLAGAEVEFIVSDAQARVLFVGQEFYPLVEDIEAGLKGVDEIVALEGGHARWPGFADWAANAPETDPRLPEPGDDVAMQMYTSGTTGLPKGVQLSNDNIVAFYDMLNHTGWCDLNADTRYLVAMPLFHGAGMCSVLMCLASGGTAYIEAELNPGGVGDLIAHEKITNATLVPAAILFVLQALGERDVDLSSLHTIIYGASPIAEDLLKQAQARFDCDFAQIYGLTETNNGVSCLSPDDHKHHTDKLRSAGRALYSVDIRLVKTDGTIAQTGEIGEVQVKSPAVMKGYWHRDEANKESFRDGYFCTGDAAYMDEEGYLYIYDRIKEMIVSGGENIYPAEVESALFSHPDVADVAIIGVPDERWGEAVKAVIVLEKGAQANEADIINFAREKIAAYKCPKSVDFTTSLPRNAAGKILRRELREPYWKDQTRRVS